MLVPSFAIGRSQQILYHLAIMFEEQVVKSFNVFLDSPMAIEASKYFMKCPDLFDEEALEWQSKGLLPLNPAWFHTTPTAKESQALNKIKGPSMIIAGAGMCNAGRILNHLHENISHENTHVIIVGFQGEGSLGRPTCGRCQDRIDSRRQAHGSREDSYSQRVQRACRAD
jgi:metallo-beta-lactamase family protein